MNICLDWRHYHSVVVLHLSVFECQVTRANVMQELERFIVFLQHAHASAVQARATLRAKHVFMPEQRCEPEYHDTRRKINELAIKPDDEI